MSGKVHTLSTKEDFPFVQIKAVERPQGPLFALVFWNPEEGSLLRKFLTRVFFAPLMLAATFLPVWFGVAEQLGYITFWKHEYGGWLVLGAMAAGMVIALWAYYMGEEPFLVRREIQIDLAADRFHVFRKKKLKLSRPWSRLVDFTVGEHPGIPLELERKRGRMGPKQRQHCLFGFFGAGGAEKIMLVARWEWPPQGSLFEVQQALVLVREMTGKMQKMMEQQGGRAALPQGFGGKMAPADDDGRPPLD